MASSGLLASKIRVQIHILTVPISMQIYRQFSLDCGFGLLA